MKLKIMPLFLLAFMLTLFAVFNHLNKAADVDIQNNNAARLTGFTPGLIKSMNRSHQTSYTQNNSNSRWYVLQTVKKPERKKLAGLIGEAPMVTKTQSRMRVITLHHIPNWTQETIIVIQDGINQQGEGYRQAVIMLPETNKPALIISVSQSQVGTKNQWVFFSHRLVK